MKYKVLVLPAAVSDLEAIAVYTKQRWDVKQARRYVESLRMDMESLESFPMRYPIHPYGRHQFRKMASGHHVLFYLVKGDSIEIVRVLHERMDVETLLAPG